MADIKRCQMQYCTAPGTTESTIQFYADVLRGPHDNDPPYFGPVVRVHVSVHVCEQHARSLTTGPKYAGTLELR